MSSILSFANTSVDDWFGFKRHIFDFEGYEAWLVEPEKKAPGMPWTWCMEWPSAFVKRIGVPDLLARGFHHVHIKVPGYACDEALRVFRRYHDFLHSLGLAERARLIGLSLGGLYSLRYAASNPRMIDRIYVDAEFSSVRPGSGTVSSAFGQGCGTGSAPSGKPDGKTGEDSGSADLRCG